MPCRMLLLSVVIPRHIKKSKQHLSIGQIRTELYVVLAVILINDTYVANLYKWSSLIRIILCQNVSLANTSHERCRQLRYEIDNSVAKL